VEAHEALNACRRCKLATIHHVSMRERKYREVAVDDEIIVAVVHQVRDQCKTLLRTVLPVHRRKNIQRIHHVLIQEDIAAEHCDQRHQV